MTINGHPAWASEYDLNKNTPRAMDVLSNSFCAGGTVLGNGTWLNVGGNQAITWGGLSAGPQGSAAQQGAGPYQDWDGGKAIRFLDPCDDESCNWVDDPNMYMTSRRWYPTLETLEDGSAIIFGGCEWGGYVNDGTTQNNPTVEVSISPLSQCIFTDTASSTGRPRGRRSHCSFSSTQCRSTSSRWSGFYPLATSLSRQNVRLRSSTTRTISSTKSETYLTQCGSTQPRRERQCSH